ncbi:MAG: hypothetical protein HC815_38395 [Richelia sp. RM1_1_1]|nr:hypothetical protein [Richelia sp. SM2_1_7]NJN13466.1 hypothetical protein [Richelia sp. RM1_1_1]
MARSLPLTLGDITRRNSQVLTIIIDCSGEKLRDWIFSLPRLLADAALLNPQELEWVDLLITFSSAFIDLKWQCQ